jgi:drug/metabolite transporter (DMT)-like permease
MVGIVWSAVFAGIQIGSGHLKITATAVGWGLLAGTFSALGNYLLVASLRELDAGVGATIYRLNLVVVAIMAVFILDEKMTVIKVLGLLGAGVAVVLFAERQKNHSHSGLMGKALLLAITASILRAGMGLSYKLAMISFGKLPAGEIQSQTHWFLAIQGLIWVVLGLGVSIRFEKDFKLTRMNAGFGLLSGSLCCGIVLSLAWALERGNASVIVPITQMSFLVTALISWPLINERFTPRKVTALALAAGAILLLSLKF